jgi:hypothetical protein
MLKRLWPLHLRSLRTVPLNSRDDG